MGEEVEGVRDVGVVGGGSSSRRRSSFGGGVSVFDFVEE